MPKSLQCYANRKQISLMPGRMHAGAIVHWGSCSACTCIAFLLLSKVSESLSLEMLLSCHVLILFSLCSLKKHLKSPSNAYQNYSFSTCRSIGICFHQGMGCNWNQAGPENAAIHCSGEHCHSDHNCVLLWYCFLRRICYLPILHDTHHSTDLGRQPR